MKYFYQKFLLVTFIVTGLPAFIHAQISPTSIVTGFKVGESRELRNIKPEPIKAARIGGREFGENDKANKKIKHNNNNPHAVSTDGALQINYNRPVSPTSADALGITFNGNGQPDNAALGFGGYTPPDPTMAVGPNHIVQMMNVAHSIYNKAGTRLSGPLKFSSIASFAGDDGDPIALYDQVADRFIILQFNLPSGSESLVFCVSKTSDPTGAYYVYNFPTTGVFPDYPHVGIWNDSYVITTHEFNQAGTAYLGQGYYAVDRKKMIAGAATSTLIRFQVAADGGYLPVSFEGFKTPDPTSPAMFCGWDSDETGSADQLMIRSMAVNFVTPASSTLSAATILPTTSFDGSSPSSRSAIEQSGTTVKVDVIADRMMSRVIYRRFDNSESLVMNYAVNVSGVTATSAATLQAAMRWYELTRPTPASAWTIKQQSTYSPTGTGNGATGDNRWMGAIDIDQKGNIAIGYSRSSSTTFPGIYYAERKVTDALSTLGAEQTFFAGSGSQTSSGSRWGDYSSMGIDPSNEDSLWYTTEYYPATSSTSFRTRIGKFKIDNPITAPTVHFRMSGTIARQEEAVTVLGGTTCLRYKDYPIVLEVDQAPTQNVNVTLNVSGTATVGTDYDLIYTSPIILNAGNLSTTITLRVYDDAQSEPDETVLLYYSLNVNGGDAVAAAYNQKHNITIVGKPAVDLSTTATQTAVNGGVSGIFNFGPNQTIHFIDTVSKKIMATIINNSSHNFGCTKVEVDRAGTAAVNFSTSNASERVSSKTFKVTPANNNVNASYTIRLYYTEAEIAGWETATGQSRSGIKMVKVDGSNSIGAVTPANQGSFSYSINNTTAGTFGATDITYETTFPTGGFSGFAVGKPVFPPLPVTLLWFKGEHIKGRGNKLYWEVTDQVNVKEYQLQFSTDGVNFITIGTVAAKAYSSGNLSYDYLHLDYKQGNNFYRLKSVDLDGNYKLSEIVLITIRQKENSVIIYPNPVKDKIIVDYKGSSTQISYTVIDATGKLVLSNKVSVQNPITIPVANLASGNYILRITDDEGVINTKFVKEK